MVGMTDGWRADDRGIGWPDDVKTVALDPADVETRVTAARQSERCQDPREAFYVAVAVNRTGSGK